LALLIFHDSSNLFFFNYDSALPYRKKQTDALFTCESTATMGSIGALSDCALGQHFAQDEGCCLPPPKLVPRVPVPAPVKSAAPVPVPVKSAAPVAAPVNGMMMMTLRHAK
jgi:hypothetical protein